MDVVAARSDLINDVIPQANFMRETFHPLLEAREAEITAIPRKTFKYGATDRHHLDVYFPPEGGSGSAPFLFFVYGGGYLGGDKIFSSFPLIHRNVGAFFAKQGFVTVIADYRLLPNMTYPDPATDIKDAVAFVVAHVDEINADVTVKGDSEHIFLMGHSAGAAIIATAMLIPGHIPAQLQSKIKGLILLGGAYDFSGIASTLPFLTGYYGDQKGVQKHQPLALLESAPDDLVRALPPVFILVSEKEPDDHASRNANFRDVLARRSGADIPFFVMKDHNHTSVPFSLFSGQGEEWAHEVAKWVKEHFI
ncbi:alpha/beta-hydrolase [Trametopsis cervina]|nr:alpha/beta-hydrolase [Trametopsis cervina]